MNSYLRVVGVCFRHRVHHTVGDLRVKRVHDVLDVVRAAHAEDEPLNGGHEEVPVRVDVGDLRQAAVHHVDAEVPARPDVR